MKRLLALLIGLIVSIGGFWYSARNAQWSEVRQGFIDADYRYLPVMLALLFVFFWLKTIRWRWLLGGTVSTDTKSLFPALMIGFGANNILPAHLGELVRVWVVQRQFQVSAAATLSSVVAERIFDVVAILIWFSLGLWLTELPSHEFTRLSWSVAALTLAGVMALGLFIRWANPCLRAAGWVLGRMPLLPNAWPQKLLHLLDQCAQGFAALKNRQIVLLVLLNSIVQWLCNGFIAYLALYSFSIPVTVATGLVVLGITAFAVIVPAAPGYFGVIQLAFLVSLNAQGYSGIDSQVLAASCYFHIVGYLPVTALGLYYLNQYSLSMLQVGRAAQKLRS